MDDETDDEDTGLSPEDAALDGATAVAERAGHADVPMQTAVGQDWVAETAIGVKEDATHQQGAIGEYMAASTRRLSRGLGRGLAALLDDTGEAAEPEAVEATGDTPRSMPVDQMAPSPYQPRRRFDQDELEELAQSMRRNGVLMPILVRPADAGPAPYEIIAGERRWRAAQLAGLAEVPVVVRELSDTQSQEVALIENIQRRDLTPLEEAQGYRRLMDGFGHTQEELAETVGKSRSHVANMLRLLNLPADVQDMLQDGRLSASHGRALAGADDPSALAVRVVANDLTVRDTERLVQTPAETVADEPNGDDTTMPGAEETELLARQLSQELGLKVAIRRRGERGSIRVTFTSLDQFADLVRRLRDGPASTGEEPDI